MPAKLALRQSILDFSSDRSPADLAMDRYALGDRAAFAEVHEELAPRLYRYLLRKCRDRATAEDLLQQTFLRMHRARTSFVRGSRVAPWAFAIATRLVIDGLRSRRYSPTETLVEELPSSRTADETVHAAQLLHRFDRELDLMPETQRSAFELVRKQGLSQADAASQLGISVIAIKLRLHRATETLHAALADSPR